jgi:ParB family chromosome partitioning protein
LRKYLGTKVQINRKGNRGKIEIEYYSNQDLERIVEAILGK